MSAMKRAAIYLRVSTAAQATRGREPEGYSIPAQREACQAKAAELDAEVVAEYADRGESAKTADRPALKELLARLEEKRDLDYVIVQQVDRLARNRYDDATIAYALHEAGIELVSVTENIDRTPVGRFMHDVAAANAEFYSASRRPRRRRGSSRRRRPAARRPAPTWPHPVTCAASGTKRFSSGWSSTTTTSRRPRSPSRSPRWPIRSYRLGWVVRPSRKPALLLAAVQMKVFSRGDWI